MVVVVKALKLGDSEVVARGHEPDGAVASAEEARAACLGEGEIHGC